MSQSNNEEFTSSFVKVIDLKLADKLKEDLLGQGFELTTPPHTLFSAKKKGVSCTLYTSGKLMVQGKDKADFITFYLEPEILHDVSFSYPETQVDMTEHIGIDEAGKGDFFGPLCVAGVCAGGETLKKLLELGVRDSKKLSDSTILKLATRIKSTAPHHIVRISPKKYNELYESFQHLNKLLAWGHSAAIEELVKNTHCKKVVIDQFASEYVVENALKKKHLEVELTQRHRGEEDPVVAAASILARAAFLEGMDKLSQMAGMELPKGASQLVIDAGKRLVAKHGQAALANYAKLHFKTLDKVLEGS
jgi:ribonuclease HIII